MGELLPFFMLALDYHRNVMLTYLAMLDCDHTDPPPRQWTALQFQLAVPINCFLTHYYRDGNKTK